MIGKEGHGERWMDDSVTLAVRVMCESTTMTDREGEVHALSADHEVVCTSGYNSMVRKGVH